MLDADPSAEGLAFVRRSGWTNNPRIYVLLGMALVAAAAGGFVVAIVANVDQMRLHAITTLPCVFAVGAFGLAWNLVRSPRRVTLDASGMTLEKGNGAAKIAWGEIGYAALKEMQYSKRKKLCIYDCQGKAVASIHDGFDDFDRLRDFVLAKVAAREDDTAERIRMKKSKRAALGAVALGLGMAAASGGVASMTYRDQRAAALLAAEGVPGEAEILRRFVAPNGITTRIEYQVAGADGRTARRNAEVERAIWEMLEGMPKVSVIYVPHEPEISRLEIGEPRETELTKTPAGGYTLSALGAVMAICSFGAAVLFWRGYDIKTDPATGKLAIRRFGA